MKRTGALYLFFIIITLALNANAQEGASDEALLTPEILAALKSIPQRPPGEVIGELYLCDPYCETAARVVSVNRELNPAGFTIESLGPSAPDWKKRSPTAELRVLVDPIKKSMMTPFEENVVGDPKKERLKTWKASALLGGWVSGRSLTTTANTDLETDAKIHLLFGMRANLDAGNLLQLGEGELGAEIELYVRASLSEQPKTEPTQSRTSTTMLVGGIMGGKWRVYPKSPWAFSLLADVRQQIFKTDPETAMGFATTMMLISPGIEVSWNQAMIRVFHSVYGTVQDSTNYRGDSVKAKLIQFQGRYCVRLGEALNAFFTICGNGGLEQLAVNGGGDPIRAVFTPNSEHRYTSWRVGVEFGITEFDL